jgi:hypothetical protein
MEGYTEYKRGEYLFRAHPNYQSAGPWFDWVIVKYETDEQSQSDDEQPMKKRSKYMNGTIRDTDDFIKKNHPSQRQNDISTHAYQHGEVPAKLLGFFTAPTGVILALIHPTEFTDHSDDSCLTEAYNLSYRKTKEKRAHVQTDGTFGAFKTVYLPALELIRVDTIVDSAFVIEEFPGIQESVVKEDKDFSSRVLLVKKRKIWGEDFI